MTLRQAAPLVLFGEPPWRVSWMFVAAPLPHSDVAFGFLVVALCTWGMQAFASGIIGVHGWVNFLCHWHCGAAQPSDYNLFKFKGCHWGPPGIDLCLPICVCHPFFYAQLCYNSREWENEQADAATRAVPRQVPVNPAVALPCSEYVVSLWNAVKPTWRESWREVPQMLKLCCFMDEFWLWLSLSMLQTNETAHCPPKMNVVGI